MIQIIILEGPDGAGKTTLRDKLSVGLGIDIGPRACTSTGGPIDNLYRWAVEDVNSWPNRPFPQIYDRHPLVSEFIYGPVIRSNIHQTFQDAPLVSLYNLRRLFARRALVIFCLPPFETVEANVRNSAEGQMPGVVDHIKTIYDHYRTVASIWPGMNHVYDYTNPQADYSAFLATNFYIKNGRSYI